MNQRDLYPLPSQVFPRLSPEHPQYADALLLAAALRGLAENCLDSTKALFSFPAALLRPSSRKL